MAVATGNFAELLWPGINKIWGDTYKDYPELYTKIFDVVQSTRAFEKYQGATGLPLAGIKDQGAAVDNADPYQGYQKEMVNTTYGLGAAVTREMYDDDQYNYINGIPKMLARSARQTEETLAWNIINRAQNAAYVGPDGVTLANASHPLVRGGTMSNQLAVAADLTQTSAETMIQQVLDAVDDDNLKIMLTPKALVVPTAISIRAEKILGSDQVTGSNDNDKNVIRNRMQIIVSPYITDSDSWFIATNMPEGEGFVWQSRRKIEFTRDQEFDTENLKFKMTWRSDVSWINFRCMYYSPGA